MKNASRTLIPLLLVAGLFGMFGTPAALGAGSAPAALGSTATFLSKQYAGDGGNATLGYLDMPKGFVFAADGSLLIADSANSVIRRIGTDGILSTYAGTGEYGTKNGAIAHATWSEPEGIASDGNGAYYVADTGLSKIRKIQNGSVSTIPINGLKRPHAIVVSGTTLYIADTGNNRVVSASTAGGNPTVIASGLSTPMKIALLNGKLYVAELDTGKVLVIDLAAGTTGVLASGFTEPRAITAYGGNLYLAAGASGIWNELWRIDPATGSPMQLAKRRETEWLNMTSDLLVGTWNGATRILMLQMGGSSVFTTDLVGEDLQQIAGRHRYGDEQGSGSVALMGRPQDVVVAPDQSKLYLSYAQGNKIAVYNFLTDTVSVLAGHLMDNYREGVGTDARFSDVVSMAISPDGKTLYLSDRNSHRIRKLDTASGTASYFTGAGVVNLIDPNNAQGTIDPNFDNGYQEGGPCPDTYTLAVAGCAYFRRPTGLVLSANGKALYVADGANNRIRKIDTATGQTSLIAGSGSRGFGNGIGGAATFNSPYGIALARNERTLYVVDKGNHAVRAIDLATKRVTTLVGTGKQGYREGSFTAAVLAIPEYLDLGPDGNLYLTEAGSFRVRKLDLGKRETALVAGNGDRGKQDGAVSRWSGPKGLAFLGDRLLVTDFKNDLLRIIDLSGKVPGTDATPVARAEKQFFAFSSSARGGFAAGAGDVNGDGLPEIVVGSAAGYPPNVRIFTTGGTLLREFLAYATGLRAGVRVAVCDLDGNGMAEIITIPGKGAPPHVRIFSGQGQAQGSGFFALNGKFRGGASLACGNVSGDGQAEIIVSALEGGGPHVTVQTATGRVLGSFMAYNRNFRGGIELGLADLDGNGTLEILTVPARGRSHVQFFTGAGRRMSPGFFAFEPGFAGGATITGGDANGDGKDEIVVGSGPGRVNEVRVFTKRGVRTKVIRPYAPSVRSGIRVSGHDLDADMKDEVIVTPTAGAPQVRTFNLL